MFVFLVFALMQYFSLGQAVQFNRNRQFVMICWNDLLKCSRPFIFVSYILVIEWQLPYYHKGTHDDIIKWKHFLRYWPFVRGFHKSPVNSPHRGQWRGALMFSLICTWTNGWVNHRHAGGLKFYRAHYDVTVNFCVVHASKQVKICAPFKNSLRFGVPFNHILSGILTIAVNVHDKVTRPSSFDSSYSIFVCKFNRWFYYTNLVS